MLLKKIKKSQIKIIIYFLNRKKSIIRRKSNVAAANKIAHHYTLDPSSSFLADIVLPQTVVRVRDDLFKPSQTTNYERHNSGHWCFRKLAPSLFWDHLWLFPQAFFIVREQTIRYTDLFLHRSPLWTNNTIAFFRSRKNLKKSVYKLNVLREICF